MVEDLTVGRAKVRIIKSDWWIKFSSITVSFRRFLFCFLKVNSSHRGVAQLEVCLLWEQDVGSSSLSTPTREAINLRS